MQVHIICFSRSKALLPLIGNERGAFLSVAPVPRILPTQIAPHVNRPDISSVSSSDRGKLILTEKKSFLRSVRPGVHVSMLPVERERSRENA